MFVTEVGEAGSRTHGALQKERRPKPNKAALSDRCHTIGLSSVFGDPFQLLGFEAIRDHILHGEEASSSQQTCSLCDM